MPQATADHGPVRAVIEVQADRHLDARRQLAPHRGQEVHADGPHSLDRRLNDHRRLLFDGCREHGLQREIVDHVDRRDTVALGECPVEDLFQRDDRHARTSLRGTMRTYAPGQRSGSVETPISGEGFPYPAPHRSAC
jgi:hypothetical protein